MLTGNRTVQLTACVLCPVLACLAVSAVRAAEEPLDEDLLELVVQFINDADRETRSLGLEQIREGLPGAGATKKFAALLPKLAPDAQAGLVEALGDRGDVAARPAVTELLGSENAAVRAAALKALGALGDSSNVVMLVEKVNAPSEAEQQAARQSLTRLKGEKVNAAIVAALKKAEPLIQAALLDVLARRNAEETTPTVLEYAKASEAPVRLAALAALRDLADEADMAVLVSILKALDNDTDRRTAELTLLAVCRRGPEASTDAMLAGLADSPPPARMILLRGLARAGGAKALAAVVSRVGDDDEAVGDEAVRTLAGWQDSAAAPFLMDIAKADGSLRRHVVAIRGLVRLASAQGDRPADLNLLSDIKKVAKRPSEKRLVLGPLSRVTTMPSLELVVSALDDAALAEEASLAAVTIAEGLPAEAKKGSRAAMDKVLEQTKDEQIRERVQKVLQSL